MMKYVVANEELMLPCIKEEYRSHFFGKHVIVFYFFTEK